MLDTRFKFITREPTRASSSYRDLENNLINFYTSKLYNETGSAVLTPSDINEVSQESRDWGGGMASSLWRYLMGSGGRPIKMRTF
ncbi:MAG TPA: hypothetical protein VE262_11075 [Blastocatellia bacterium]|nr:hypothetical protein [Blastocatellia bacterium]